MKTLRQVRDRYTEIRGLPRHGWQVRLVVDHQSFTVYNGGNRQSARWFRRMLAIALHRMLSRHA